MHVRHPLMIATTLLAATTLAACSDDATAPVVTEQGQISVGFQLAPNNMTTTAASVDQSSGGARLLSTSHGMLIVRANDTIVVTRAQLVVRDVQLAKASASCPDNAPANGGPDSCPTVHVGPFLVDIATAGGASGRLSVNVPEGTYSKVRLSIHKVTSSDTADRTFREAHPELVNLSVKLEGTYNGQPFTFTNDVNGKIDAMFTNTVAVAGTAPALVTVQIDVAPWFSNPSGGLFSPLLANLPGVIRATVEGNIRTSFRAFKDANTDGQPD